MFSIYRQMDLPFLPTGTGSLTCLPRHYTKGDHDFPDVITASPFYPVVQPFLRCKRPSTRIYSPAYGKCTRTRTRFRCILRSLSGGGRFLRISSIVETLWDVFLAGIVSVWEEYININAVICQGLNHENSLNCRWNCKRLTVIKECNAINFTVIYKI